MFERAKRDEGDGRNEGKERKERVELTTNFFDTLVSANEIVAPVMRSVVMGDFHDPKSA